MSGSNGFGAGKGFGGGKSRKKGEKSLPYKNPHNDPFSSLGDPTGDLESDSNDEVQALGDAFHGFKERAKKEQKRFAFAVDSDYWTGVCFRSFEDKKAFLDALDRHPRMYRGQRISGYELADILGLEVEWTDRE